jgi:hypothetical protein
MEQGTYELKYCERCGSLGTRRADSSDTYCESCAQILTQVFLPASAGCRPRLSRTRASKPVPPRLKAEAEPACGRVQ